MFGMKRDIAGETRDQGLVVITIPLLIASKPEETIAT
jgi:hypothetical protein